MAAQKSYEPRMLELGDYKKGFLQLLSQLTTVGEISEESFKKRFQERLKLDTFTCVIEDTDKGKIIASASLMVESKFIHQCGKAGHIEDVVVNEEYRGQRLGLKVVEYLKDLSKKEGCYKVILDCADHNIKFYEKANFVKKENEMVFYFEKK